jgi:Ni/Fe-hydrogenase subunit HybB-like protein
VLMWACAALFVGIWVEKGVGMVIPGFVPSPLGEIVEYTPTWVELCVTAGIWAMGLFVLTVLVRVALPIELGESRSPYLELPPGARVSRPRSVRPRQEDIRTFRTR